MQVASVLTARQYRFSIRTFVIFFEAVCQTEAKGSLALRDCRDMNLIEMQLNKFVFFLLDNFRGYPYEYFLHPYIQQYVESQYCNDISNIKSSLLSKIFLIFTDLWTKGELEIDRHNESSDPAKNTTDLLFILMDCSNLQYITGFASLICQAVIESHIPLMAFTVIIHKVRDEVFWLISSGHFLYVQKLFEIFTRQKNWLYAIAVACSVRIDAISKEETSDLKKFLEKANRVLQNLSSSGSDYQMYKSILNMLQAVYYRISDNEFELASAQLCVIDSIEDFEIFCREIDKRHSRLERRNCIEALCYLCRLYHDEYLSLGELYFPFSVGISQEIKNVERHPLACFKMYTQICLDLVWDLDMKEKKTLVDIAKSLGCCI